MRKRTALSHAAPVLLAALALSACSSSATGRKAETYGDAEAAPASPPRAEALGRDAALLRVRQISRVTYNLWFGLDETHDDYEGRAVITFDLKPQGKDLSKTLLLDFEGGTVRALTLNGQAIPEPRFDGHRISFAVSELRAGNNRVEVAFTHPFSTNGSGLHRFKDPVDGNVYLYSDFEPYDAHRMFPCFDQPDLKASFELTVEAPETWQVISNTPERDVTRVDGRRSWQFPPSPIFSTYVFALHAGPYASWKSDADGIPTRLFSRQSLKQYVDHQEWLDITKRGLDYFNVYFGYPYPYAKYDQVIVPDFNSGAMENAAAVTFSERYVYRSKVTRDRRRGRANTILHEMAHMWFGDLVTMRWWNGLWLNESFATFMATKAVDEATPFKGGWQDFFGGSKQWAYWEDQLVTTHPIEGPVHDTDQATNNFDGITYGKGASALKQLAHVLGNDDFREGLQRYFQKYALRNTTVGDFIRMLSEASGKDLSKWQRSWLQTSGVNTVRADWACADADAGRTITRFELVQSPPEGSRELRTHRAEVALYRTKGGKLRIDRTVSVLYSGASTPVPELLGAACPELVYPNHGDHDYAKVELDPASLGYVTGSLARIDDPLARQMLWHNLWEMVTDGKLRAQEYAAAVLSQGDKETDTQVLARVLRTLVDPRQDSPSVAKIVSGTPDAAELWARFEKFGRGHLASAPAGSDQQLIWYRFFLDAARSPEALAYAHGLLTGKHKVKGLKIDQDRRWELILALARGGAPGAQALIEAELKTDSTDMGQKAALAAGASLPDASSKQAWLGKILRRELPFPKLRETMRAFHIVGQEELSRGAVDAYFEMIPKLASLNDDQFMNRFASTMYPGLCDPAIVKRAGEVLSDSARLPAQVVKSLRIGRQEDERCIRARARAAEGGARSG